MSSLLAQIIRLILGALALGGAFLLGTAVFLAAMCGLAVALIFYGVQARGGAGSASALRRAERREPREEGKIIDVTYEEIAREEKRNGDGSS